MAWHPAQRLAPYRSRRKRGDAVQRLQPLLPAFAGEVGWRALREAAQRRGVRILALRRGRPFESGGARFEVLAPAAGVVSFAADDLYLTGGTVLLDHGHGVSSNFLHLSRIDVAVGETVEQGEPIGLVGATGRATGPHLHFEVISRGANVDPLPALS